MMKRVLQVIQGDQQDQVDQMDQQYPEEQEILSWDLLLFY